MQGLLPQGGLWPEGDAPNRPRVQIGCSHSELLLVGVAGPELADRHRVGGRGSDEQDAPNQYVGALSYNQCALEHPDRQGHRGGASTYTIPSGPGPPTSTQTEVLFALHPPCARIYNHEPMNFWTCLSFHG